MTIYLFDHAKALIGELDNVLSYEQTQVLGGKISAEITAVYSKLVEDTHYFGSKDVDDPNIFWMYRVTSEKKRNGQIELTGIHLLFDELQAKTIRDIRPTNLDPATALSRILQNTAWEVGIQQATGIASSNYYYQSNLSAFWDYLKKWHVEFKPRLTFANGQITGRFIDIFNNMSGNFGKRFEYGDKLIEVEAEQANENIYTALIGLGKGEETGDGFGRKINFSDVVWSTANGDPVNKPIGQDYVEIPGATAIYGFRETVIDFSDIEDREDLLQATYLELLNVSRPKVEFSSSAVETGMIELGETITIIRDDMGIRYQTRVFELVRNFLDKTVKSFRFGDRIITSSAERIREDREKTENKIKEQQSLLVAVRNQITDAYWGTDGYNYDLRPGNEYGLPAGLYSFDKPIDQDPTEVIYVGSGRALIANSKDVNGQWEWRTALTAEGFAGDQVVTGSITANKLSADVGQSLDLSSNESVTLKVQSEVTTQLSDPLIQEQFRGEPGPAGNDGASSYTFIRYSPNANGSSMTTNPQSDSMYIGVAIANTPSAPTSYTAYTWSRYRGLDGNFNYTWVKYADDSSGSNMSNSPTGKKYIGLAFNKTTNSPSMTPSDYQWSEMYDTEMLEDIQGQIIARHDEYTTSREQTDRRINDLVTSTETIQTSLGEQVTEVSSQVSQLSDVLDISFTNLESRVTENETHREEVQSNITFDTDGDDNPQMRMGRSDRDKELILNYETGLRMVDGGVTTFEASDQQVYTTRLIVLESINFGNHVAQKYGETYTIFNPVGG